MHSCVICVGQGDLRVKTELRVTPLFRVGHRELEQRAIGRASENAVAAWKGGCDKSFCGATVRVLQQVKGDEHNVGTSEEKGNCGVALIETHLA